MKTRMTIDELEQLKTHELADMLSQVVLLLRRMPNIECKQLIQPTPEQHLPAPVQAQTTTPSTTSFTYEELHKKKVDELKKLAKELHVLFTSSTKKADLIQKILVRSADGRSEQRAIQDL
ncbi:MAG TPA: Rho termination factor N-terminal domain-containing protein [Ktedonobacteraceae bacterium]|jgi:hypothetical protein|nr:Rho termination factor N-terminal domain-containing protein [Ktedonobacteraceae bacterium]